MNPSQEPALGHAPPPVRVEFTQDEGAPGLARRVTRQALTGWGLRRVVDPVVLVVSELVTNAVRYGKPPISMELRLRTERVRLAVHDGNPSEPVSRGDATEPDAESGRGMAIVAAVDDELIVEQVPDDGKIIRAVFDIRPPPLEP